jgi:uncharacterized protein YqeY
MSLKIKIKEDFIQAMKNKETEKKVLLSVILGEIQNEEGRGTKTTNDSVMTILRKMEKSLKQTNTEGALVELKYLEAYLPKLMSEDQIREIVLGYKAGGLTNVGQIMGQFNKEYKNLADNRLVSTIIAEV